MEARLGLSGRSAPAAPTASGAPATWIYVTGAGDSYWRCQAPARALGAKLAPVPQRIAARAFTQPNRDTPFPWFLNVSDLYGGTVKIRSKAAWERATAGHMQHVGITAEFPKHEGVAVWTRPDIPRAILGQQMQEQGIRVLAETDDNYFANPERNLFLRQNRFGEKERTTHAKAMAMADGMVFSTAALRDTYVRELRSRLPKRMLPESFVCRNHVPSSDWPERVERDGPIRVGFMGSSSHVWDINLAYAAFHAAHAQGAETTMIGYSPGDPDPDLPDYVEGETDSWRSDASLGAKTAWGKVISKHIRWIEPDEYHRAALPLDIGLCPLKADSFTLGKSDVKAVEYTISGAAVVAQNNPVYNTAGWVDGVNCLMAGSAEEFAHATLRLMRDPKLRFELVTAAQQMVAEERNEHTLRNEWEAALAG